MTRILLVEPDDGVRAALKTALLANRYQVLECQAAEALPHDQGRGLGAAIVATSLGVPAERLVQLLAPTPVLMVTDTGVVREAVEAIRQGAADYLVWPLAVEDFIAALERVVSQRPPGQTAEGAEDAFQSMFGHCSAMLELFEHIRKVAPTEATVLIQGESGTGKELAARALHAASHRQHAAMISLNCATIPDSLIESELFGHEGGARARHGLVEAADGGTLFLDEIGQLPLESQTRLLRVLEKGEIRYACAPQSKRVNVRLVAATHRDLEQLVRTGAFREDLLRRLREESLDVPPLRSRGSDIAGLAEWLLARTCDRLSKPLSSFSHAALDALCHYDWPGNVRELENAIEHAVILSEGREIDPKLLAIDAARSRPASLAKSGAGDSTTLEDYFVQFVLEHQEALTETELAERLGISRKSLWERRQRLSIPRRRTRKRGRRNMA